MENGQGGFDFIHPMVFVEFFVPGLRRLQVHYRKRNRIHLLVVAKGNPDEILKAVDDRMSMILSRKNLLDFVEFDVEIVDSILPDRKTGKTKTLITTIGPPKNI